MHLCFGSFAMTLLDNRKNNAVTKVTIGRELLSLINPDYPLGKDDRYVYCFMDQERELPKELKGRMTDLPKLCEQFAQFSDQYLGPDHERLLRDLTLLIQEDAVLPDHEKSRLLQLAANLKRSAFLAEVYVFAVDSTANRPGGVKPRVSRKRFNLLKEIHDAFDDDDLYDLAEIAIQEQDIAAVTTCFGKMTNHVYIALALVFLAQDKNFADHPDYMPLFHATFSGMKNNRYRHEVFEGCLKAGYFKERPEHLLETHMREYTNNRYAYDTLIALCKAGLYEHVEQYRYLLTNKTYIKRLRAFLYDQPKTETMQG